MNTLLLPISRTSPDGSGGGAPGRYFRNFKQQEQKPPASLNEDVLSAPEDENEEEEKTLLETSVNGAHNP